MNSNKTQQGCVSKVLKNTAHTQLCNSCVARKLSMCSVLKDSEILLLANISDSISKLPKQIICSEGDDATYLYNIRNGCVRISKMLADGRRQVVSFLYSGDFFGLASDQIYGYSAESITNTDLCCIPIDELFNKFAEIPALGPKIIDITRSCLQSTHEQILMLGRKNAKEKLCSFLLTMNKKTRQIQDIPLNAVYIPMSRSDIADYIGLTIETVSRQFTILSKEKIISIDDSLYVKIIDKERMELIASGE